MLDYAVLFNKTGDSQDEMQVTIGGEHRSKILLCNIAPGTWSIQQAGLELTRRQATDEERCIYFQVDSGTELLAFKRISR